MRKGAQELKDLDVDRAAPPAVRTRCLATMASRARRPWVRVPYPGAAMALAPEESEISR